MARPAPHRGAAENPAGRFERIVLDADVGMGYADPLPDPEDREPISPRTELFRDPSRRAFAHNESPDIPFDTSLNPYRGCEHGCVYCFARPSHEFLGLSAGLDFETKLLVKDDLPRLVREALSARRWRPQVVAVGAVTDAYQPVERRLRLTRRCLEVFAEFRNPLSIVTKSALVTRDADLLGELARHRAASVAISITSLDPSLQRVLEPRAAAPSRRLAAVRELTAAGIPVSVMVAPVIPGLNDHEAPAIVAAAAEAGALDVKHLMLRLPHGVKELFASWLERHFPDRKEKVLRRVREMRGGRLNDPRFSHRHTGSGFFADQTHALFELACRRARLPGAPALSAAAFRRPGGQQLALF
jgi:DNA repair photolyase